MFRIIKYEWKNCCAHFLLNCLNSPNKADKSPMEQLLQIKLLPRWWYCVFQIHRMRVCRRIEAMTTSTMVMSIRSKIIKFAAIDWHCWGFLYGIKASTIKIFLFYANNSNSEWHFGANNSPIILFRCWKKAIRLSRNVVLSIEIGSGIFDLDTFLFRS